MRDYDINKQGGKKMVNPITPEHSGPEGHKIPDFFQGIAQNLPQPVQLPQIPMLPGEESNPTQEGYAENKPGAGGDGAFGAPTLV